MVVSNHVMNKSPIFDCQPGPRIRPRRRTPRIHYKSIGKEGVLMKEPDQDSYRFEPIPESIKETLYK